MYKVLLILKYLRKRRIAWVSLVAVTLCTAMVLVVISVMGGWLRMFRQSYHSIGGDITVTGQSMVGFPHYQEMIDRIVRLPGVKAAVPVVRTYGLANISNRIRTGVEVMGYTPDVGLVNEFRDSLHYMGGNLGGVVADRKHADEAMKKGDAEKAATAMPLDKDAAEFVIISGSKAWALDAYSSGLVRQYLAKADSTPRVRAFATEGADGKMIRGDKGELHLEAVSSAERLNFGLWPSASYEPPRGYRGPDPRTRQGIIVGSGVIGLRKTQSPLDRPSFVHQGFFVDLTVLPISADSSNMDLTAKARNFYWIIDDSHTGVFIRDAKTVYVPFATLQQDLQMDGGDGTPARCSDIEVALKPGADLQAAKAQIGEVVSAVIAERNIDFRYPIKVQTWEEVYKTFLGAVEKEKGLVTILFGLISIVAVFLIFCIFYMIVVEKTRDIGIVKSVGATSGGVAGIFLGYGLAIGLVGAGMGLLVGYLIVHYINQLHEMLGRMGLVIWDPEIYLFDRIPSHMNPPEVAVILAVAVVASVAGALVPAYRAARMHPVEALRWE